MCIRDSSPRGRNRGSRTAADTAAEATASPSGCSATREPMQPRSDPCSVIVTKAAPGSSSAAVTGRDSCRGRGACVAAAATASRAIRRSAVVVSRSSDTGAGRPADPSDPGGVVPCVMRYPNMDMRHLPRRANLVAARPTRPEHKVAPFPCRSALAAARLPAETRWTQEATVPSSPSLMRSAVPAAVPTRLSSSGPDGSVRCGICAHRCLVRPGRAGICGVRENRDGVLMLTVYGAVAAIGVDPIEKKPLFHVAPGTLAYSIATPGCPFHCTFCQNWEIAQAPRLGTTVPTRHLSPERVDAAREHGATSIAYTYVEPTVFLEYAVDTARLARAAGLLNVFVTDGYATPEAICLLAPTLDAANVDLKSFSDSFYRRRCGATLAPVLEALETYRRAGTWLEVTTLIIPGENDDPGELRELTAWIVAHLGPETPWHVSRFFPAFRMLDVPPTPIATLRRAVEIGREAGLLHVYLGNAPELSLEDTRCAGCDALLIERHGYRVFSHLADDGSCPACGRILAGRELARGPGRRGAPGGIPCG